MRTCFLNLIKRFVFWLPIISIAICLYDIWETVHAPIILLIGLGPLEPFHHWMLDFDPFQPPSSADLSAKWIPYLVHFVFFFVLGAVIDYLIQYFNLKKKHVK